MLRRAGEQNKLDLENSVNIIIFTYSEHFSPGGSHARFPSVPGQARSVAATGYAESPPPGSYPRSVPAQRLLRHAGPAPGEVRDVAPSAHRKPNGEPDRSRLWFLPSFLLSGASGLR